MNTNNPERVALRAAIEMYRAGDAELFQVREMAGRAAAIVVACQADAAKYADLDREIAAYRAAKIKAASSSIGALSLDLSPELAQRITAKAKALTEVEQLRATQVILDGEVADVKRGLELSTRAVHAAAAAVIRSEVDALARRLAVLETEAAALRQHIQAYTALRTDGLPSDMHQPSSFTLALVQSQPKNVSIRRTREQTEAWAAYHEALGSDAAALPPQPAMLPPHDPEADSAQASAALQAAIAQARAWAEAPRTPLAS